MEFDKEISLLGVCERYAEDLYATGLSGYHFLRKSLIGLKDLQLVSLIPFPLSDLQFVLIIDTEATIQGNGREIEITVMSPADQEVSKLKISPVITAAEGSGGKAFQKYMLTATAPAGVANAPGEYKIVRSVDGESLLVGRFYIEYVPALPLTPERIRAIKSDALAAKHLRYVLKCSECKKEMKVVCGIDREKMKKEDPGYTWYTDLPDRFRCDCGKVDVDLKYIKESLHSFLGYKQSRLTDSAQIMERAYTQSALEKIAKEFETLLNKEGALEEEIQKFIESNPIILGLFSAVLIKDKASATAKYKTDFALVNTKNELVLIEIEKPSTKLFKEDGGQHSELTAAFDQVEDWLTLASRNRLAILDDIGINNISIDKITNIRGIVIAGRKNSADPKYIGKLLIRNIEFFTFDDLLDHLRLQIQNYYQI